MKSLVLPGLRAATLGGYLQGLGLLRVLSEQVDAEITLHWSSLDEAVLTTHMDPEEITRWLVEEFVPSPVITPWNAGSGFAANGKSKSAEKLLDSVRGASNPRLELLREVVGIADEVVEEGRQRGWEGKTFWDDRYKREVIQLCRRVFPDAAQGWLDVAVTLTVDDVAYNPLVGTGGNFGRQDLSATYLARMFAVIDVRPEDASAKAAATKARKSSDWARALLLGDEDVAYERDTVGQFDPGRAGGILTSPMEKNDDSGFVNPWAFLLTLEGAMLFAAAPTRRLAAAGGGVSWPFFVYSTPVGYSSAADEDGKGEQWAPLWQRPARAVDVAQLIGEGRIQWRGRTARTGLEFALGLASLGQDTGLSAFRRYVIVNRLGQNPLAVPAGRVTGFRQVASQHLQRPYKWIERIQRVEKLPAAVRQALRTTERTMYKAATEDSRSHAGRSALADFVIAFGALHRAVSRSGKLREQIRPYVPDRQPADWPSLLPDEEAMWLAAAFASLCDPDQDRTVSPRALLTLVRYNGGLPYWSDQTPSGYELSGPTLTNALASLPRLRAQRLQHSRTLAIRSGDNSSDHSQLTTRIPYSKGLRLPRTLLQTFLHAEGTRLDTRIAGYLGGLLVLGVPYVSEAAPSTTDRGDESGFFPPALAVLLPAHAGRRLTIPAPEAPPEDTKSAASARRPVELAPRWDWAFKLSAGKVQDVLHDALLRLRLAGCPPALRPADVEQALRPVRDRHAYGNRLAAALLLRPRKADVTQALKIATTASGIRVEPDSANTDQPTSVSDSQTVEGSPAE
ncbi:type I-U CRISPR-associated protein Csx17 [Streptomyces sp. NPDC059080]|uniref:type I-G CRISPR-associated protein Cas8g1/Csx17 n=1 Tax=Streptomyces sp. NPDC059080 TaxID=3346718 RepID=UPI0036A6E7DB